MNDADQVLVEQMRLACDTARQLIEGGEYPKLELSRVRRVGGELQLGYPDDAPDWQRFLPALTRVEGFWDRMTEAAERLKDEELIRGHIGFMSGAAEQGPVLWSNIIGELVHVYGLLHPTWAWDQVDAEHVVESWRDDWAPTETEYRTLAPLDNLVAWGEPVVMEDGFVIREMTDDDRQALWRSFGLPHNPSTIAPTLEDIARWSVVAEVRWMGASHSGLSNVEMDKVARRIEHLVCAQRLNHPGIVGVSVIWTRVDPPELAVFGSDREMLFARDLSRGGFESALVSQIGPNDGEALRPLVAKLSGVSDKRLELALRRFNAAYARKDPADTLIDLWVAFEALVLTDGNAELQYRAALRIARFVGDDKEARKAAFDQARSSYKVRSKVVHGESVPEASLEKTVRETRDLARQALKRWVLDPPAGGVEGIDDELLA
jgi:hypothetical protein